jgi:hypothetical protein
MRLRNAWVGLLGLALAGSVVACGGSQETSSKSAEPSSPSATPAGQRVDTATAGDVKGVVTFDGVAPKNEAIKMNADPVCVKQNTTPQAQETYIVGDDGKTLGNVFVYVKDGLGNYVFDTPTETAKIDQQNCRYHPHVFGVRVNQPIQGMKMTHTFDKPEVMVPFKCDVHGWMNAYVGVLPHPYFAVTDKSGKFELKSLPPGTYTIEAWHEKLGAQTANVTLGAKESKDITFGFKAPATATN